MKDRETSGAFSSFSGEREGARGDERRGVRWRKRSFFPPRLLHSLRHSFCSKKKRKKKEKGYSDLARPGPLAASRRIPLAVAAMRGSRSLPACLALTALLVLCSSEFSRRNGLSGRDMRLLRSGVFFFRRRRRCRRSCFSVCAYVSCLRDISFSILCDGGRLLRTMSSWPLIVCTARV